MTFEWGRYDSFTRDRDIKCNIFSVHANRTLCRSHRWKGFNILHVIEKDDSTSVLEDTLSLTEAGVLVPTKLECMIQFKNTKANEYSNKFSVVFNCCVNV